MDDRISLYGTDEPPSDERLLTAGPLTAIYTAGALRSICLQGVEVVRGIYFLVRDRDWATAPVEIRDLAITESDGRFEVRFAAHCRTLSDGQILVWHGHITGSAFDGVRFEAEATPTEDLVTRRTGFIVLHPLERAVGAAATIEQVDGQIVKTTFPDLIDPIQSFFGIRAMTLEPIPGIRATCRMEGGGWETEDHRNWLDASFKTYFRALGLPHPYTVAVGEPIRQKVSVSFAPSVAGLAAVPVESEASVTVGDRTGGSMPEIALCVTPRTLEPALAAARIAAPLGAQAIALRLRSDAADLPGLFRSFAKLADALGADPVLEIGVSTRSDAVTELELAAIAADAAGLVPVAVFVTPEVDLGAYPPSYDRPPSAPLGPLYTAARAAFPGAELGGGQFHFFTELNRRRPPVEYLDYIQHATAANVHAADDRSVMETLESLPHVFRSVRAFAGGATYRIGPASIGMAANPYGSSTAPNPDNQRRTMVTDDPRHKAQFGAAWAAGYLVRAAHGGVARVSMGEPTGPFGLIDKDVPTPMFHALAIFAALAGQAVLQVASSEPRGLLAVASEGPCGRTLIMANLVPQSRTVRLAGLSPARLTVIEGRQPPEERPLPENNRLSMAPYGVARVTW